MNYSPKLKKAMDQIKSILKENDIAGVVVLHTPGFSEYLIKIDPTYSCARLMPDGSGVRLKTKGLDIPKKKKRQMLTDTCNMLHHLSNTSGETAMSLFEVSKMIDQKLKSEHEGGGHTSNYSNQN